MQWQPGGGRQAPGTKYSQREKALANADWAEKRTWLRLFAESQSAVKSSLDSSLKKTSSNKFGVEKSLTSISLVTLSQFFPFSQSLSCLGLVKKV